MDCGVQKFLNREKILYIRDLQTLISREVDQISVINRELEKISKLPIFIQNRVSEEKSEYIKIKGDILQSIEDKKWFINLLIKRLVIC